MRNTALIAVLAACLASPALAQAPVTGVGRAPVTKDVEAVRAKAELAAKLELVRTLARQTIGAERLNELTPDMQRRLADQIRPDMIVDRRSQKVGAEYEVSLSARIDQSWFQGLLDNEGVQSSVNRAGGMQTQILVMLDEQVGAAQDYAKPAEIVTEYDRQSGSSFKDKSASAYSEKERAAESFKGSSASSVRGSASAAYSDGYGAGAARTSGSASSATRVEGAAAYSHSVAAVDKTDVEASTHDNERFRQRVTYQSAGATGPSQYAKVTLNEQMLQYGVQVAEDSAMLSTYFNGQAPTFGSLKQSARFEPFLREIGRRGTVFFMGGTIKVQHSGLDVATGQAVCTGSLDAQAFATGTSQVVAAGSASAEARGTTYEDCTAKLGRILAERSAVSIGPKVQNYWRNESRSQARTLAAVASGPVDYTLVVRANSLSMAVQADLMDALATLPGVESHAFLGQTGNQISLQVRYGGSTPLQMALFQKLRANPAFAQMQPTVQGQSVTLCLSGC